MNHVTVWDNETYRLNVPNSKLAKCSCGRVFYNNSTIQLWKRIDSHIREGNMSNITGIVGHLREKQTILHWQENDKPLTVYCSCGWSYDGESLADLDQEFSEHIDKAILQVAQARTDGL
jgi:hypothetical protein